MNERTATFIIDNDATRCGNVFDAAKYQRLRLMIGDIFISRRYKRSSSIITIEFEYSRRRNGSTVERISLGNFTCDSEMRLYVSERRHITFPSDVSYVQMVIHPMQSTECPNVSVNMRAIDVGNQSCLIS